MSNNWAQWELSNTRPAFLGTVCDLCKEDAIHIAVLENDDEVRIIKARCDNHFNLQTQKKWLKQWRNKNIKD